MCGLTGYIDWQGGSSEEILRSMVGSLNHRGPDDFGVESIEIDGFDIGLGHARLSINDLSPRGHQPMSIGNLNIVFNGEIYNYREIREELIAFGFSFTSDSDTEVILQAYKQWGIDCLKKFIGMFAFVLFDEEKQEIYFVRDRVGVKPLYIYEKDGLILFGSELKSLMRHPKFEKDINRSVLPEYLNLGYISAPKSIFRNTRKVMPGTFEVFSIKNKSFRKETYWEILSFYKKPKLSLSYSDAKEHLHGLLKSAYAYRMVADVPVGVFLSGGYDSSSVAAILSANSSSKLETFTIGFREGNNEAPQAKQIAVYLNTKHTEYYCSYKEVKDLIEKMPFIYDEPFGDSSAIPTTLVSKMAKDKVTVALSADGGDEQIFGYGHYFTQLENLKKIESIRKYSTSFLRKSFIALVDNLPVSTQKSYQWSTALRASGMNTYERGAYLMGMSRRKPSEYIDSLLLDKAEQDWKPTQYPESLTSGDVFSLMDYTDYLPNDILTKVDRASMSVSLEGREPMLDHRIAEFTAQLPLDYKFLGERSGKRILKDIVHDYIPKPIMDQPKRGFTIPVLDWLKGDLRHLLDQYLSVEALEKTETFDPKKMHGEVKRFLDGELHYKPLIWYALIYQMWYFEWVAT